MAKISQTKTTPHGFKGGKGGGAASGKGAQAAFGKGTRFSNPTGGKK